MLNMSVFRAVVRRGHLVLDEPTDLPEGEVVELRYDGPNDDDGFPNLSNEERARLDAMIDRGIAEAHAGNTISAEQFLREIEAL